MSYHIIGSVSGKAYKETFNSFDAAISFCDQVLCKHPKAYPVYGPKEKHGPNVGTYAVYRYGELLGTLTITETKNPVVKRKTKVNGKQKPKPDSRNTDL